MSCLCCGAGVQVGVLCRNCAQEVAPCEGLIADHLRSTIEMTDADAWVVDGFGKAHAIAAKSGIGRSQEGALVVLATSVSREHAELRMVDGAWHIRDLGSRNGTFVDGVRTQGRVALGARTKFKVGDVALWFLGEVAHEPTDSPSLATGSAAGSLVRFMLAPQIGELCLVGGSDTTSGGSLLHRIASTEGWKDHNLPPLEFQLLRTLCVRAAEEASSPASVRGCVATKQLARDLPWQSKYANEENVRQVVRRLRGALGSVGCDGILAVAPGRGYYLACAVTVSGH